MRTLEPAESSWPALNRDTSQNHHEELRFRSTESSDQFVSGGEVVNSAVEGGNPSRSTRSLETAESSRPEPDLETSPSQNPHVELQNLLAQIFPPEVLDRVESLEAWLLQTHFAGRPVLNYCETRGRETVDKLVTLGSAHMSWADTKRWLAKGDSKDLRLRLVLLSAYRFAGLSASREPSTGEGESQRMAF
eukprot:CAMPEP_0184751754 /NCGR_PEP_ID=MMETSP0315-20130426/43211_1 /TAXON_ID=101924 /ORGANISM="Rhodosorus marinus, Strain UTEX LB 2760" /LENGTH=190 /DNA_ID=CAMNT_0027231039 /DNA_START=5531 /DNA_END=6103 /DNA_ORIENTATION=+